MKRIIFIVALSVCLAPVFCSGIDYYVDSQAASSGDGSSSAPYKTIQEGIDAANSGDTVYLRGSLYVLQASQCVVIPADKPELTLAKWGADRFSIEVDNDFIKNVGSTNIITVCAQSNTISGLEFIYHKNSLGLDKSGKGSFIFFRTNYQTVADCRFYRPANEAPAWGGVDRLISGQSWGGTNNNDNGQDYMTISDCIFENAFGYRGDTHKYPIGVGNHATIANCVFSNCWAIAASIQNKKFNNHTVVSNVLILAAMDSSKYLVPAEQGAGVFASAWGGMGKGEIAYNVFVGRNHDFPLFNYGSNEGFNTNDKVRFHHNTVIGFACLFSGGKTGGWDTKTQDFKPNIFGENKASLDFFDNIIDANVLFFENATNVAHQLSAIKAGSVLRNNAVCLTNNDVIVTGKATTSEMYNLFDKLTMTNNVFLANLPEFVETNDVYSADFYRPKLRREKDVDLRRIGWMGENNEYPRFVGAREPIAMGSFTIHLR